MSRFLRVLPGENEFREVNEKQFKEELPFMHQDEEWGHVIALEAEVAVYDRPGGKLVEARRFPSHSFVRWFARIIRMMYSFSTETLTDTAGGSYNSAMAQQNFAAGNVGLLDNFNSTDILGAAMGIGVGVGAEDSGYFNLISPSAIQSAQYSLYTTTEDTTQITYSINEGITNATAGTLSVTEIALFSRLLPTNLGTGQSRTFMMAYDQITSTPVTQGGVIAPKYTISFVA